MSTPTRTRPGGRPLRPAIAAALLIAAAGSGSAARPARLVVVSTEAGRQIWIGDRFVGTTPVLVDSLEPGRVEVEVGPEPASPLWVRPWRTAARLLPGAKDTLSIGPLGMVHLRSDPPAAVRLEDEEAGRTPLSLLIPIDGRIRLELAAPGRASVEVVYEPRGVRDSTLALELPPLGGGAVPPPPIGAGTWERRGRLLLPVGAVLAGVTGAWARLTADRAYDDYHASLDRGAMAASVDRARRYDRVAVACWIGAEACLVSAAWLWLRAGGDPPLALGVGGDGRARVGLKLPIPGRTRPPRGRGDR